MNCLTQIDPHINSVKLNYYNVNLQMKILSSQLLSGQVGTSVQSSDPLWIYFLGKPSVIRENKEN